MAFCKKPAHFFGPKLPNLDLPPKTFSFFILKKLSEKRDQVLYVDEPLGREVTCGEVRDLSVALGNGIMSLSLGKEDRCCICSYNIPECVITFLALDSARVTPVWSNALTSASVLRHQLFDSAATLLFIPGEKLFMENSLKAACNTNVRKIVLLTDPVDFKLSEYANSTDIQLLRLIELYHPESTGELKVPKEEIEDFDTKEATILYTSGTTGTPKGVILSHESMRYLITMFSLNSDDEVSISIASLLPPMCNIYGLLCGLLVPTFLNTKVILYRRFDFERFLKDIKKHKVDTVYLLPAVMTRMIKDPMALYKDLSSIRLVSVGAAPLPGNTIREFFTLFDTKQNLSLVQLYGMTEGSGSVLPGGAPKEIAFSGSVGQVSPDNQVKIVDLKTLKTLPLNEEGEIWTKSKTMMKGYLNRPEETSKTITEDGWLRTGDIGYFREDGYLFITDRLKELVKYKGYQVPPAELEAVLLLHPDVLDAGVTGKPDAEAGQIPIAFVVLKPGIESSAEKSKEIQQFVNGKLQQYEQACQDVIFLPEIPRNESGKTLRKNLIHMV